MARSRKRANANRVNGNRTNVNRVPARMEGMSFSFVTDDLVETVLARGVPEHLSTFEALKEFLVHSFFGFSYVEDFFLALKEGLQSGNAAFLNKPVLLLPNMAGDPMPMLLWVTKFRFFNKNFGCRLSHDMVELVVKAGANIHHTQPNSCNVLFFAVKYASLQTVDYFLNMGVDVNQKDCFGRTCLVNALELPDPAIMRRLLERLPATEIIPSTMPDGERIEISLIDLLLSYVTKKDPPVSWVNMGIPPVEHLVTALLLLRQGGARLSPKGSEFSLAVMGAVHHMRNHPQIKHPTLQKELSKVLIGAALPQEFRPNVSELVESLESISVQEELACAICFSDDKKFMKLYCGHPFCRDCIIEYGQTEDAKRNGCPLCKSRLCLDALSRNEESDIPRVFGLSDVFGITKARSEEPSPRLFTDAQVDKESRAQGIYSMFSTYGSMRTRLQEDWLKALEMSQRVHPIALSQHQNGRDVKATGNGRMVVELSNNVTMVQGSPSSLMILSPLHGPACIEVTINGITMLARISTRSTYTVVSKSVREQLNLRRIEKLSSRKFVDTMTANKVRNSTFTCLEPVTISLGNETDVTLRNAVEMSDTWDMFGIQLGMDFLSSGIFCVVDVEVGAKGNFMRCWADGSCPLSPGRSKQESFRFYDAGGLMVELPLLHFNPFPQGTSPGIALREHVSFDECSWCCRLFPEGMLECAACADFGESCCYCDERCQKASWPIHKRTQSAHLRN